LVIRNNQLIQALWSWTSSPVLFITTATSLYIVIETPDASAAVINSDLQKIAT